jgi:hypothetical protein
MSMDEVRVGDAERDDALQLLAEHLAAGRIDIDEHSERTSRIIAARTRGEIKAVFADLPDPHPLLDRSPATTGDRAARRRANQAGQAAVPPRRGAALRTFAGGLTPFVWCVCIAVFVFAQAGWWVLLVPIAYSALLSAWAQARGDPPVRKPSDSHRDDRKPDG